MEYGCIGYPLSHSFSKQIHAFFGNDGYELCEISDLHKFMTERNFKGINVTIPYKTDVIKYLDFASDEVQKIGACNTIINKNGMLYGYNTDVYGLTELLHKAKIDLKAKTVAVLGTGGTSKTAQYVAKTEGASKLYVVSRTPTESQIGYENIPDVDVIINTTPVGMYPQNEGGLNVSARTVVDVIYNPFRTNLVQKCERSVGGLYMLVAQGAYSHKLFFGNLPDIEKCCKKTRATLQNIVLIGMPSCGKSTVGREISAITGMEFVDTDELVSQKIGSIAEFIKSNGEEQFRKIESEAVDGIYKRHGLVIATGGGTLTDGKNAVKLRQNGMLFYLEKPLSELVSTADRPLSDSPEKLRSLYENRHGIYKKYADFVQTDAQKIIEEFYESDIL